MDNVRRYIKKQLVNFILKFHIDGYKKYYEQLKYNCINNIQSLIVQYQDLKAASPNLILWMATYPRLVFPQYNAALYSIALKTFPAIKDIIHEFFFKIDGLPMNDSLRVIPYNLLGKLIKGKIFIIKLEELLLILDRYGVNLKNYYINV